MGRPRNPDALSRAEISRNSRARRAISTVQLSQQARLDLETLRGPEETLACANARILARAAQLVRADALLAVSGLVTQAAGDAWVLTEQGVELAPMLCLLG